MKRFMAFLIMLAVLCMTHWAYGSDWQLKGSHYKTVATDPESIVQSGEGLQISLHYKSIYFYISEDSNQVRFAGQNCPKIDLQSIGLGFKHKISDYLIFSCQAGIYIPCFKENKKPQVYTDDYVSPFAEGLCRYLNKFLVPDYSYPAWNYYTLEYEPAYGGQLNFDFVYPLTKQFNISFQTGYRYLELTETIQGKNWGNDTNFWIIQQERSFSTWIIGGALTYKF